MSAFPAMTSSYSTSRPRRSTGRFSRRSSICCENRRPATASPNLFIRHDLRVVRALAREIAVMKDGKIVEAGATERVTTAPEHPYTRALMAAAFDLAAVPA
jgi:ABC-type antimicrobial peptide transport system ATPase subunit